MRRYNIKMHINEVMYKGVEWIQVTQNSGQGRVLMNKVISPHVGKFVNKLSNHQLLKKSCTP